MKTRHLFVESSLNAASNKRGVRLYEFKSDPEIFEVHYNDLKNFDERTARDRDVRAGDIGLFREFDRATQIYSGREFVARVLWVLHGPVNNMPEGEIIMSLHPCTIKTGPGLKPELR
jgi:hypothetical protein